MAHAKATNKPAATAHTTNAMGAVAAALAAPATQASAVVAATAPTAAQLAAQAAQAAALVAQPTLPPSLVAMVGRPVPAVAQAVAGALLVAGKPFACHSHNAVWAAAVTAALANGPQTAAALAQAAAGAGSPRGGMHSVKAYIKRGNLVPSK